MASRLPRWIATLVSLAVALTAGAASRNNDDSCDIGLFPAATLLLPYFEVDLRDPSGERAVFTITNAHNRDAIARVTLWTDRAYPVVSFNVFLTGYDVQAIDLYALLTSGRIAGGGTGPEISRRGKFSDRSPAIDLMNCVRTSEPLDALAVARLQEAFTLGSIAGECAEVGDEHRNAIGYATVDVVGVCSETMPDDPEYWTHDLRYDNVLLGESQNGPLVHIRAIPEGGLPRDRRKAKYDSGFPRTFYARFTDRDGRQPLPARFAARWTKDTSLKIWREGRAGVDAPCSAFAREDDLAVRELVVFDEEANAVAADRHTELPAVSRTRVDDASIFPQPASSAENGWLYLNLDRSRRDGFASQAWVVDAIPLGNGCSAPAEDVGRGFSPPPPGAGGLKPRPTLTGDNCDVALLPAATLLLPYFEAGDDTSTRFSITNVSPDDRIARVTLWTDYAFPVVTFNVRLDGYQIRQVDLADVIYRGLVPAGCAQSGVLSHADLDRIQRAFLEGVVADAGELQSCPGVGREHENTIGYATVDVVRNCANNSPWSDAYWVEDLAWDNVLIGDYERTSGHGPLVHIRAIPEGGTSAERLALPRKYDAGFQRTFYGRYQHARTPKLDGRQPLPSVFSARWEGQYTVSTTHLLIWKEGLSGRRITCADPDPSVCKSTTNWVEAVIFDEVENAVGSFPISRAACPIVPADDLPSTSRIDVRDSRYFADLDNGAKSGWLYLNLDHAQAHGFDSVATSNWVISSIETHGDASVDVAAIAFGNGCSPSNPMSEVTTGAEEIGPLRNTNP